jgi:pimeloyl-ACP methyl ester carboxylesterase
MTALRTPDARFASLPGFPFAPHHIDPLPGFPGLRMHYVDEGARDAPVALCLHGQPTWSYLYRRMIPPLCAAGYRVVAPDMFGFGRSDKPVHAATYTFDFHRDSLMAFVRALDLKRILLVVQDWGGLIGLTMPMDDAARYEKLIIMNTGLGTADRPLPEGFLAWRAWANANPDMAVGKLIKRGTLHLTDAEAAAYDAPFPDVTFKAGVQRFPNLVPDNPDAPGVALSRRAREWWSTQWNGKSFMAIGGADPVFNETSMRALHAHIRNCPPPLIIPEAGHFVQEWGDQVVAAAIQSFQNT